MNQTDGNFSWTHSDATSDKFWPQCIHTNLALSTKSTLLFIKREKKRNVQISRNQRKEQWYWLFFRFVFREEKWHSIATAILTFVALNANSGGKCMRILLLWVCMAKVIYPKCYEKSNESCRFLFLGSSGHFGQHWKFCQMLILRFFFCFHGQKNYSFCTL